MTLILNFQLVINGLSLTMSLSLLSISFAFYYRKKKSTKAQNNKCTKDKTAGVKRAKRSKPTKDKK